MRDLLDLLDDLAEDRPWLTAAAMLAAGLSLFALAATLLITVAT